MRYSDISSTLIAEINKTHIRASNEDFEISWKGASLMGIQSGESYQAKFILEKYPERFKDVSA